MRTFLSADEDRFWTIEVAGAQVVVCTGKVGQEGQTQTYDHPDPGTACADSRRRVARKLAEHFTETFPGPATGMQKALEAALIDNPDDRAAHSAYADWLAEQPDPTLSARGEFIAVQLALEGQPLPSAERQRLQQREQELQAKYERAWLGPLGTALPPAGGGLHWRFARGWLESLRLPALGVDLARVLGRCPATRLLRTLSILDSARETADEDYAPGEDTPAFDTYPGLWPLERSTSLTNLRVLNLGDTDGADNFRPHSDGTALPEVLPHLPRLVELNVNAANVDAEDLFKACKKLRKLAVLRLDRVPLYEDGVRTLVRSRLLKRLHTLQIWHARLDSAEARILARSPDLKGLQLLDVSFNWLEPHDIERLRATGVNLRAEDMVDPAEDSDGEDLDEFDLEWE